MKYLKENDGIDEEDIQLVAEELKKGKIAIFPTETVYGIGTNAFDNEACKKIYEIKNRPNHKPLIVLISNMNMLFEVAQEVNEIEKRLMERFWPGPLTIILKKKNTSKLSSVVSANQNDIGVRMTNGKVAKMLVEKAGVPIVAPSANLSGNPSGTKIENIIKELGDKVDYILDCGDIEDDTTSTLVKVENDCIHILRQGKISKKALEKIAEVKIV